MTESKEPATRTPEDKQLAEELVPVNIIQKALGHSTIGMTMKYTDMADDYLQSLAAESPRQPGRSRRFPGRERQDRRPFP